MENCKVCVKGKVKALWGSSRGLEVLLYKVSFHSEYMVFNTPGDKSCAH